ncbi:MAG TPA: hypothetical protein VHY09_07960, partial [Candidatus Methylacidiphilales bacterium]|nr:hypothetical protein [Candidatus Methylacidiphilales bacterium]
MIITHKIWVGLLVGAIGCSTTAPAKVVNLVQNPDFESATNGVPDGYELTGAAAWGRAGGDDEYTSQGVIFSGDAKGGGSVSQVVHGIDQAKGRWLTFRFRGLAQDGFAVDQDALAMKIAFYSKNGTDYLDGVTRLIYREITTDRQNLTVNGDYHKHGAEVWRSYELEELIPYPEADTVKITVVYANGAAASPQESAFYIDDFSLVQRQKSQTGKVDPATAHAPVSTVQPDTSKLTPLGGRWYYEPAAGEKVSFPLTVTEDNAD